MIILCHLLYECKQPECLYFRILLSYDYAHDHARDHDPSDHGVHDLDDYFHGYRDCDYRVYVKNDHGVHDHDRDRDANAYHVNEWRNNLCVYVLELSPILVK